MMLYTLISLLIVISQKDLIHTIGESAALGAAGFVIWGDLNLTSSRVRFLTPFDIPETSQKHLFTGTFFHSDTCLISQDCCVY